ncbi:hypothetical protein Fcan01_08507 [Folsomia candida]|uniref:Uncharacterized protein n=1 Tax=Folsomia candida TaxID=158441 RepID=A0A226ELB9_FOLCA|nr:hypothetical protein Fcan01_08507 [Folsomia candida]
MVEAILLVRILILGIAICMCDTEILLQEEALHFESNTCPQAVTPRKAKGKKIDHYPSKLHSLGRQSPSPTTLSTSLEQFSYNFKDTYINLINQLERSDFSDDAVYSICHNVPVHLFSNLDIMDTFPYGKRFYHTHTKYILRIAIILLIPIWSSTQQIFEGPNTLISPIDKTSKIVTTHFREIIYIFLNSNHKTFAKKFTPVLSYGLIENENVIPSDTFIIGLSSSLEILEMWYVCKQCDYLRYHFHQMGSFLPDIFRPKVLEIHKEGLNYIWKLTQHEIGYDPASSPLLQEIDLQTIAFSSSSEEDLLTKLLLQLVLTKSGTTSRWLNVTRLPYGRDSYPQIVVRQNSYPNPFFHHVIFDMDSFNFITCNGFSKGLDFNAYINPFDVWIWTTLTFFMVAAPLLGCFVLRYVIKGPKLSKEKAKIFAFRLAEAMTFAILSQFYWRVNRDHKVYKTRSSKQFKFLFRVIFGTFLLNCIVLVNYYIGLGITNLTAQKPQVLKWHHIENIHNSTILISFTGEKSLKTALEKMFNQSHQNSERYEEYTDLGVDLMHALYDCHNSKLKWCLCFTSSSRPPSNPIF